VDTPINFSFNALGPATPQVTIVEPTTKLAIPIPIPSGLRPPLVSRPATSLRKTIARDTANLNASQAALRALSSSSESADAVTASGTVDAVRYGRALQSRRLVGVRGVGFSYDGLYYVKQVTHRIKRGEYKQSFNLTREGHGALTPMVIP
jgi:phage protein D